METRFCNFVRRYSVISRLNLNVNDCRTFEIGRTKFLFLKNYNYPHFSSDNYISPAPRYFSNGIRSGHLHLLSRSFHCSSSVHFDASNENNNRVKLRLSTWPAIIWPSVIKTIRNWFFMVLIRGYLDDKYSSKSFLDGAEQAIAAVSESISVGNFDALQGLVADEAIDEVQKHYHNLDMIQRRAIHVCKGDIFFRYIYEIGIIFDDITNKRFVEITAVFQGYPGIGEIRESDPGSVQQTVREGAEKLYICNYRFIREFTKGVDDQWTINRLNHFRPADLVADTPPFSR